jgi:type II secretory pathway pseudopilin PulG
MKTHILAISAVVVGLLLPVSGSTATPSYDESADYFQQQNDQSDVEQQQQQKRSMWHEPPVWAATYSNDEVGRRLQDECLAGTNPYSSTTIASSIGTGSPGAGSCTSTGNPCSSTANPTGDRCVFPQCNGDGFAEGVWDKKFDNWSGTTTADTPASSIALIAARTRMPSVQSTDAGTGISMAFQIAVTIA